MSVMSLAGHQSRFASNVVLDDRVNSLLVSTKDHDRIDERADHRSAKS